MSGVWLVVENASFHGCLISMFLWHKVDVLNSVFSLIRPPIFEWLVVWCGWISKRHHVCRSDWIVCARNMIYIPNSIVNIIVCGGGGTPMWPFNEHNCLHFGNEYYELQRLWGKCLQPQYGFANHLVLNYVFHILREVGCLIKMSCLSCFDLWFIFYL